MKRLVFLICLLFSILFYAFDSRCNENIIVEPKIVSSWSSPFKSSTKQYRSQEGFCANTLIQTPSGYKAIKKLNQGDIVIGCNGREKRIVAITKYHANRYIKLIVNNTTIRIGYDQFYYRFPTCMCVAAHNIKAGDMLLNDAHEGCSVIHAELINENKLFYYLTVEDHIFCIAPCDLYVHNAEALILGFSSMCLGNVIIINPIAAMIGATIAFSVVAQKAYQAYIPQYPDNDQNISRPLPTDVILAERSYYIERSVALEQIKQQLLCIKNDFENLKALCANSVSFTHQFLKQTITSHTRPQNQLLQISAANEIQLSDNQKKNLRILREFELEYLEQEISALQITLAFHINELMEQAYAADDEYIKARKEIDLVTNLWNNNLNIMTDSIALQSYKADLLDEHLLNNLNQKVDELKIVAHYYHSCMDACIKQSTNISDLLEKINFKIIEYDQRIVKERARVAQKICVSEHYFARRGIFIGHVKNETKNYLEKGRNGRNAQAIAEAKNKLTSIIVSGGPQNNNNKNDNNENFKDFWENLKSKSDKNARSMRFGKMYRDPITKLWWSQDLAGHGGSSYKVFKETAKGFEWIYDAAKDGARILNKHKGPTGLFIPYKEVIFRT